MADEAGPGVEGQDAEAAVTEPEAGQHEDRGQREERAVGESGDQGSGDEQGAEDQHSHLEVAARGGQRRRLHGEAFHPARVSQATERGAWCA
jgi:hypothetical protein